MANLECLLAAAVALLVVFNHGLVAGKDLDEHCRDLRYELVTAKKILDDPVKTMNYALHFLPSFGITSRARLATAWKRVVKDAKCSSSSLNHIGVIGDCNPDDKIMKTLVDATERYANKCLTPEYIADRISSATEGIFASTGASVFVDDEFIADYRQLNPNERSIHFAIIMGDNCCRLRRSYPVVLKKLDTQFAKKGINAREHFRANTEELEKYLRSHLFEACKRYVWDAWRTMHYLYRAGDFYEGREGKMLAKLDQKTQNAIFRFKFCEDLDYEEDFRNLISKLRFELNK